jgi:uncharacterized membrane protein (DUF4010 family)
MENQTKLVLKAGPPLRAGAILIAMLAVSFLSRILSRLWHDGSLYQDLPSIIVSPLIMMGCLAILLRNLAFREELTILRQPVPTHPNALLCRDILAVKNVGSPLFGTFAHSLDQLGFLSGPIVIEATGQRTLHFGSALTERQADAMVEQINTFCLRQAAGALPTVERIASDAA